MKHDRMQDIGIPVDDGSVRTIERDLPAVDRSASVVAYFDDLEARLTEKIERAEVVVGCVAWLTSERICRALARVPYVSLVVQKEDFLRPDVGAPPAERWRAQLRAQYRTIPTTLSRFCVPAPAFGLSCAGEPYIAAIRCAGYTGGRNALRSHHKFAVFGRYVLASDDGRWGHIEPLAVWTGSYNWTRSGERNLENAVYIESREISAGFLQEWACVLAISEPLDWESEYADPEWRVGT